MRLSGNGCFPSLQAHPMGANDPLPGLRSEHTIAKKPGPFPHKSTAKTAHLRRPAPTVGGPPSKVSTSDKVTITLV